MAEIDSNYRYLTYEEMGKEVAEKAFDEILIKGKTLREWMQTIVSEDCISRKAVLSKIKEVCFSEEWVQFRVDNGSNGQRDFLINYIEQLPSVTPQHCEDTISRQEVLNYIRDNYRRWFINDDAFMQCINGIKDIISVTPQQKVGKWIRVDKDKLKCSECEVIHFIAQYPQSANINYCPNCGMKMEVSSEETTENYLRKV